MKSQRRPRGTEWDDTWLNRDAMTRDGGVKMGSLVDMPRGFFVPWARGGLEGTNDHQVPASSWKKCVIHALASTTEECATKILTHGASSPCTPRSPPRRLDE